MELKYVSYLSIYMEDSIDSMEDGLLFDSSKTYVILL
jgi:hypothetical protein